MFPGLTPPTGPTAAAPLLLVVVAHPDDETFGTGSLLLHAAAHGYRTAVCCATRGEAGEPAPGTVVPDGGLGVLREAELREAAAVLGVETLRLLDFTDSGMAGDADPGTIVAAGPDSVADAVAACVDELQPDVLVTLDGSDGHRDHAAIRDATVRVAGERGLPLWLHCIPRDLMQRWVDHMNEHRPRTEHLTLGELGTPVQLVELRVDTAEHLADRERAIALHRSQTSPYEGLPPDLRRDFLVTEHLRPGTPA